MGLSWQQGPLSPGAIGRFLVAEPLPKDCYTPSLCAGACACASAAPGLPRASMSFCCSNPATIRWPTFRRPTSLPTL